jgi:excisionase family DNA binding protein
VKLMRQSVVTASENRVEEAPPPYRVRQAARKLGVSNKAILDALKNGRLAGFRLNRMWLIPRDEIDQLGGRSGEPAADTR